MYVSSRLVFPGQVNHLGTLFGGDALRLMDEAAFVAAARWARRTVVTAHSEGVDFSSPVFAGELLSAEARVCRVGRTSLTVEVELYAENLLTGERRLTTRGSFVMVALGVEGRPVPVEG
jgi:uncharacterized protein (TIGR00369 family)